MSRMNANIILAAQQPNILGALAGGAQAAGAANQVRDQNALRQLYAQQGPGIAAGDPNALNALAGLNPGAAIDIRRGIAQDERADAQLRLAEEAGARAAAAAARDEKVWQTLAQETDIIRKLAPKYQDAIASGDWTPFNQLAAEYRSVADITPANFMVYMATTTAANEELMRMLAPEPLSDAGKLAADIDAGILDPNAPGLVDPAEVDKFRKEFSGLPAVKNFSLQTEGVSRIIASAQDPSPASDLALIFNFMKVLDPNSVVRESEFQTAEQASRWLQEAGDSGINVPLPVASAIRRIMTGDRLSEAQRQDFVNTAAGIYRESEQQYRGIRDQFVSIAESRGYPVDQALIDFAFTGDLPGGAPGAIPGAPANTSPPPGTGTPPPDTSDLSDEELERLYGKRGSQ